MRTPARSVEKEQIEMSRPASGPDASGVLRISRRFLTIGATVALAASLLAGGAMAGHQATGVKSYTGCLANQGGTLTLIREGETPAKPCPSGSVVAHFSGADITGVTAGFGLTGGGINGNVSIALDPAYVLRQDCADGQVVEWDNSAGEWICAEDDDTTYTAGEGLVLDGTEFSLDPDYALPDCELGDSVVWTSTSISLGEWGCAEKADADQACPADQFADGIDEFGGLECSDPGSGGGGGGVELVEFNQAADFGNGVGIPDDGTYRSYASTTVGAGTWLFIAKGTVTRAGENQGCVGFCDGSDPVGGHAVCRLMLGGTELDRTDVRVHEDGPDHAYFPFALTNWESTSGATVSIECAAANADGVGIRNVRGVAINLG